MSEKRISVIMPVYNAESYVRESVADVLAQTYQNLEIILVDDGSTDNSLAILREFAVTDNRVKIIESENKGPSHARNLGLDVATGEYIRFVDADDRIPKDSMERLVVPYQEYENIDLVIGNYTCVPDKNYMTGDIFHSGIVEKEEFVRDFATYTKSFYFGVPWNKLYRRDLIQKYDFHFDESIVWCEDLLFNIDYYECCSKIYRINCEKGIYEYIERSTSITKALDKDSRINMKLIEELRYNRALTYCKKYGADEMFRLEWNYANTYGKLSRIAKCEKGETIKESYQKFITLLNNPEIYQYICMKQDDSDADIWRWMKKMMDIKCYVGMYLIFFIKGCFARYMKALTGSMKRHFKSKFPKLL